MDMRIFPGTFAGSIEAVASKSEAHRLLICAALADGVTDIDCNTTSQDIDATAACMRALGARVTRTKKGFRVVPVPAGSPHGPRQAARAAALAPLRGARCPRGTSWPPRRHAAFRGRQARVGPL